MRKLRKVFNELTIEVGKVYEDTNIFETLGSRLGSDSFDLDRVH